MTNVALCISGQMRTYEECIGSLRKNVIDILEPDVFIHTWRDRGVTAKGDANKIESEIITYRDLEECYSPVCSVIEEYNHDEYVSLAYEMVPDRSRSVLNTSYIYTLPMFHKILKCDLLRRGYQAKANKHYDAVIRLRPDMAIYESIPENVIADESKIWYSDYWIDENIQVSDKFVVSSPQLMKMYADVWNAFPKYWTKMPSTDDENLPVGERLLYQYINEYDLPSSPFHINCSIIRSDKTLKIKKVVRQFINRELSFSDIVNFVIRKAIR